MSPIFPDSLETPSGVLAATQATLLDTCRELSHVRTQLAQELAEKERLRRELRLRDAALDAGSSHFMLVSSCDPLHPIVYVNRTMARDYGFEAAELIGQSVAVLKVKDPADPRLPEIYERLRRGQTVRDDLEVVRRDGTSFCAGFTITPLRNRLQQTTHYVVVGADITTRKEAERKREQLQEQLYNEMRERERISLELRLAQKLESVGRLAAGLAHEINTPIQYVGDSVSFLRSAFHDLARLFVAHSEVVLGGQVASAEQLAAISSIEREIDFEFLRAEMPKAFERTLEGTQRVTEIVRAMKEFAHPDGSEQSPADLNHALEMTLIVARNEYKYAATVATQFGEIPPVTCNVGELNQVFLNLIVNAAHAIQDSQHDAITGRITVSTRALEKSVEITVADNGCGIPQENLEKIYDPFFTTKAVGRGTGQGLPIARAIVVDKHGGDIRVESYIGVGTRFTIQLPINGRGGKVA
jgi:PAS domain S-box-containing protein